MPSENAFERRFRTVRRSVLRGVGGDERRDGVGIGTNGDATGFGIGTNGDATRVGSIVIERPTNHVPSMDGNTSLPEGSV